MRCEEVLGSLAVGERTPEMEGHLGGCARCARALAQMRGGGEVRVRAPSPSLPGLRARERRERLVKGALAAAVLLVAWRVLSVSPTDEHAAISRPPEVDRAGLLDALGGEEEELASLLPADPLDVSMLGAIGADPLADLDDPTELFDALPGEGSL